MFEFKGFEMFYWTIGGMGLTGVILRVAIKLRKVETSWIKQKTLFADNLNELMDIFEKNLTSTYSVAWIDCLKKEKNQGRSIVFLGEHANLSDLNKNSKKIIMKMNKKSFNFSVPFYFPNWFMNKNLIKFFNFFYFWRQKLINSQRLVNWDSFIH